MSDSFKSHPLGSFFGVLSSFFGVAFREFFPKIVRFGVFGEVFEKLTPRDFRGFVAPSSDAPFGVTGCRRIGFGVTGFGGIGLKEKFEAPESRRESRGSVSSVS